MDAVGPDPAGAPRTNRQIEDAGLRYVISQEALAGRIATDTRGKRAAGDLTSGDRVVEVKAYGGWARGQDVWLEVRQIEEARSNPDFWLYLVENIRQGDPAQFRLLRVGGQRLTGLLTRAVERRYFTMPFPVAVYDAAVRDQPEPLAGRPCGTTRPED